MSVYGVVLCYTEVCDLEHSAGLCLLKNAFAENE